MGFIDDIIDEGIGDLPGGGILKGIGSKIGIGGSKLDNLFFREYRDPVYNLLRTRWDEETQWGPVAVKFKISHDDVKQGKDAAYYTAAWNRLFAFVETFLNGITPGWGNQFTYLNNKFGRERSDGAENYWKGSPVQALQESLASPAPMEGQSSSLPAKKDSMDSNWFETATDQFNASSATDWKKLFGLQTKWPWWMWAVIVGGGLFFLLLLIWLIKSLFKK